MAKATNSNSIITTVIGCYALRGMWETVKDIIEDSLQFGEYKMLGIVQQTP